MSKRNSVAAEPAIAEAEIKEEIVHSIKGYDKNLCCRGFAFEIGKTHVHDGEVEVCASGFHAISGHPLELFEYYPPAGSRYTETQQSGSLCRHRQDSKVASAKITIGVELHLHELIQRAVKWVFDRANPEGKTATGNQGAASATGYQGAASATGDQGAASATGYRGCAQGADGNALFLVYRDPSNGEILHVWAGIVGTNNILPDVWYTLNEHGEPIEVPS